jgi:hypothetical protein
MTTLEIPESLYKRLQKHAIPLEDTHTTVLERILNDYELRQSAEDKQQEKTPEERLLDQIFKESPQRFNPDAPPDLRHADVRVARFAGRTAFGWNKLVHEAHLEVMSKLGSIEALRNVTKSNFMIGRASSEDTKRGYRHVPGINISIQNVDASHAWSNTLRLARHLRVEVEVEFEWKQKADAAHPGRKGRLGWKPQ